MISRLIFFVFLPRPEVSILDAFWMLSCTQKPSESTPLKKPKDFIEKKWFPGRFGWLCIPGPSSTNTYFLLLIGKRLSK